MAIDCSVRQCWFDLVQWYQHAAANSAQVTLDLFALGIIPEAIYFGNSNYVKVQTACRWLC